MMFFLKRQHNRKNSVRPSCKVLLHLHHNFIGIDDLGELLLDLNEIAAFWFTVGLLLKIPYSKLMVIKNNNHYQCMECLREMLATWLMGSEALPSLLVHALRSAGMSLLAKKMAVKHGKEELYKNAAIVIIHIQE